MVLNLSDADRKELEADLAAAEPYDEDDPVLNTLDGDINELDFARFYATMAKKFLAMDKKQREEQNDQDHL